MNLLLIDSRVPDSSFVVSSLSSTTQYVLFDFQNGTLDDLKDKINNLNVNVLSNVGIFQHNYNQSGYKFVVGEDGILDNVRNCDKELQTWKSFKEFIKYLVTEKKTTYLDLLSCNIFANFNWRYVIEKLQEDHNIKINASSNKVGYTGNWILDYGAVDLTEVYFTDAIKEWKFDLSGSTISTSTSLSEFSGYSWPITVSGGSISNPTTISLTTNQVVTASSQYFIVGSAYVTIDGGNNTIFIGNVTNYAGLVRNGNATLNSYSNVTVQNIVIDASTSTLANDPSNGWIAQRYFKKGATNNYVINCSQTTTTKSNIVWNKITGNITLSNFDDYYWPVTVSGDSWGNKVNVVIAPPAQSSYYPSINVVDPSCYFIIGGKGNVTLRGVNFTTQSLHGVYGMNWLYRSEIPMGVWGYTAMSADGQYLITMGGGNNGYYYISSDYGATFSAKSITPYTQYDTFITMSGTGQYSLTAIGFGIYYSNNYGQSFTKSTYSTTAGAWMYFANSYSGKYAISASWADAIYYSTSYGVYWTKSNAPSPQWYACAMSYSGQYAIACAGAGSYIYYSIDYGVTWTVSNSPAGAWGGCTMAGDTGIGYAVTITGGNFIYKTTNFGVTWTNIYTLATAPIQPTQNITTSSDGSYIALIDGASNIVFSTNSGNTWSIFNLINLSWGRSISMSADGSRMFGWGGKGFMTMMAGFSLSLQNLQNYPGLVQNGTSTSNAQSDITVADLLIDASSSTLNNPTQNGWYGQRYFSKLAKNIFVGNVFLTKATTPTNIVYNTINGNTTIADQFDDYCWPITISGDSWGNKTSVTVTNPITLVDASHYFIIGRGNVTLDGQSNTFSIPNVTNYTGMMQNGSATAPAYSNVTVQNIVIDASTSTLANDPSNGWIAQRYFKKGATNNYLINCSKTTTTLKNDIGWNKITGNIALSNFDDYYWPVTVSGDSWGNRVNVNIISASGNYNSINIVDPSYYFIVGGKGNVSLNGSNFTLCTSYGSSWIQSSLTSYIYEGISMSNSGQYCVVATSNSGVRYSTNYGMSWATSTNVQSGSGQATVVISGNGLISFSTTGTMYYSTNGGVSYVATSFSMPANGLSISYTGQYGIVCGNGGYIHYTSNYGLTWTQSNTISAAWWSCAISQTTSNAIACVNGGLIYFSDDYGGSWRPSNAINGISLSASWQVCGLSSDGSGVGYAAISQGQVYKTYDFGKTWALLPNSIGGSIVSVPYNVSGQIAMSSNGEYVLLGNGTSFVFASTDGGNSWKQIPFVGGTINNISMSADGKYAIISSGYVYYMNFGSQISIQNITNYPGFIQNGTETTSGQSNITVQNIVIDASSSTLENSSQNGWVFQRYIKSGAKNVYVNPNNTLLTSGTSPNALAYNTIYGNVTLSDFDDYYWPVTVSGDSWNNKTTVSIANPIAIIDASAYFIIGRGNITIDGQSNLLSITNVSGYAGFVQNGNISMNGYNDVTVQNIIIDASTSTLLGDPSNGWVAQRYFQKQTVNTFVINSSITTTTTRNSAILNRITGNTVLSHFDDYVFPVTISGDSWNNLTVVTVSGPINIVDPSHYFIIGRKNIRMQNNQPVFNPLNGTGTTTWVRSEPNNYFWYDVTMSSTGQYVIAVNSADNNTAYTLWHSSTYGLSWYQTPTGGTNSNMSGGYNWKCVTMTPNASIAYAGAINTGSSGQIYVCNTLTINNPRWKVLPNSPFAIWRYMATSENGQVILASTNGGYLYLSINGGTSWSTIGSSTFGAVRVAVSTDGTKLLAAEYNGNLWVSTNMGSTWSKTGISTTWQGVAMTPTGSIMYATTASTSLYYSSNYGVNWQTYPNCPALDYRCVSVSSDGTKIVLPQFNGAFITSTDSGNSWTASNNYGNQWMGVAMSYNGQTVIIVGGTSQSLYRYNFFPTYINICNLQNYPGLIQNGTATTNAYGNVYVQNMFIDASSSTVAANNGWIAQQYFQKGPSAVGIFVTGTLFTASTPNPRVGYSTINGNIALSNFDDYLWPVTVSGDSWNNKTTVSLTNPITIIDASHYFIIGQGNVTIDGQSNLLSISNVSRYPGLVENGNVSMNAYSNVTIQNIVVDASTSTLMNDPSNGWLAQRYFKKRAVNNYVINCSKTDTTTKNDVVFNKILGNITLSNFDDYYWPITISGDSWGNKVTVTLSGSLTIVDPSSYFIVGGKGNVTINSTQSSSGRKLTDNFAWNATGIATDFRDVAMNSNGQYGIAGRYAYNMYYTSNFGTSWVTSTSTANWIGVTMSQSGQYAMSVSYGGQIWLSTSYGVFWTALSNSPIQTWSYISMSSNGQIALASVTNGYLYFTTNMGNTWTQCGISANWNNVKISGDGTKAVVCTENAQLYYSTNSFATFTPTSVSAAWRGLGMSTDGTKVLAGGWGNGLYFSTNSGVTFAQCPGITGGYQYRGAEISDDGQTMIVSMWGQTYNSGSILISTNGGNTFFSNTLTGINQQFWGLALSRDNRIVFSPSQNQNLYVFQRNDAYTSIIGINNYPGFIQNGTSTTDAYSNVSVNGLVIDASTSTLNSTITDSWIMQKYFTKNAINITASGDSVQPYTNGLALPNVIYGNTTLTDFADYFWPITISGDSWGNKTNVTITSNITIADASHYFIIGQGNVSITGNVTTAGVNNRYSFNVNAVGHPFWIQTVPGGYSEENIYNTGVTNNGTENGTITIEVPYGAPNLYYACQYHSSMAGSIVLSNLGETVTLNVTNSGSGAYTINGSDNASLSFIRGNKYAFNVSASGHPFWIQTVPGAYSPGNIYSTGVTNNGIDTGIITIDVPYDAPNLYYACQYHSSMAGSIEISNLGETITLNVTNSGSGSYIINGSNNPSLSFIRGTATVNSDPIIYINGVSKFPGLVQNGTSTKNAFNNVTVSDIIIDASTSTLANDPSNGWIAQRYFKKGATGVFVNSCSQTTTTTKNNIVWNSIVGNIAISNSNIDDYYWPVNIGGDSYGNYSTITLSGSLTIIDPSYHFTINNNYVNVSGSYFKLPITAQTMVQTSSTSSSWWKVASSYNGQYAIATLYGNYTYYSNDYGNTWTAATNTGGIWARGVAMSSSGQYAVMNAYNNGYMYYSTNYGQYWSIVQSYANANYQNTNWNNVAMSSSGQYVYAMSWGWYPSYSTNYGVNWTQMAPSQLGGINSYGIATSANGQYVAFSSWGNSGMYVSSNYGTSFVTIAGFANNGQWGGISMSSSGQYMVSATGQNNGYIYYSSTYGLTWAQSVNGPYINWWDCAMDQTGQYCVAAPQASYLYFSSSYGVYWQQFTTFTASWQGVTITTSVAAPSGTVTGQIIAVCNSGYIYRSNFNGNSITISNVTNYGGLIQNGTETTNAYNNVRLNTLFLDAPTSTLYNASSNGWIMQKYFKKGITTEGSVTVNNIAITSRTLGSAFANLITGNTTLLNENLGDYFWPINVGGDSWGNKTTVSFDGQINIVDASNYFIASAGNVTIDGQNNSVTINGITNYPGLVQNGTSTTNGFNNIVVQNITIDASSSTLANDPSNGWIAQRYFKKGATGSFVNNCSQTVTTTKNNVVWNSILGNITLTSSNLHDYYWPTDVSGDSWGNKTVVTVSGPLTIIDPSYYFNIVANNVCISGNYIQPMSSSFIQRSPPRLWSGIAISSTGQYSVGVVYGATIFRSSDYGVTWNESASSAALGFLLWTSVCMSSDGAKCVAAVQNGYLYYSSNYGLTWTKATTPASTYYWTGLAMSSDGNTVYACVDNTWVFKSVNSGVSWSQSLNYGWGWRSIACSSTGQYVIVASNSGIYYSINSGSSWAYSSAGPGSLSITMSTDGSRIYTQSSSSGAINATCFIHISTNYGVSFYQNVLTNTISNVSSINNAIGNIYTIGNGATVYMTFTGSQYTPYNLPYLISTNYGVNFTLVNNYIDAVPIMGYGILATNSTSNMIYTSRGFRISTANNLESSNSLISINRVSNYEGLIQNENSNTGISVTNIIVDASSSTLNNSTSNGWILQSGFENGLSTLPTLTNLSITSSTTNSATPIVYGNITIDNEMINYVWPITISGDSWGNKTTVSINSSMNITDASQYFIISRGNVTIDGLSNTFSISNVTNYPGLVQNGTATTNAYNNVTVQNIIIDASSSTLFNDPSNGWIAQRYFKKQAAECYVINCNKTDNNTENDIVWNKITGNITLSNFDDYCWPVTVSGDSWGNKTVVTVSGPITIYDASAYFVMAQGNIAINGNCSLAYGDFAESWNIINDNTNKYWNGVAVSRSGTYVYAVEYQGYIWASSNSGANWYTVTTQTGLWSGIATSANGQYVVATMLSNTFGGYTYSTSGVFSTNFGVSWSNCTSLGGAVYSVAMSSTGQYVYAFYRSLGTWMSTNYGVSFFATIGGGTTNAYAAVNDDGAVVMFPIYSSVNYGNSIQYSTFYNSTGTSTISFTTQTQYSTLSRYHLSVCVSGNGSTSFSAGINTQIFRSTNSGATYYACANSPTSLWNNMACSSDGTKIVATQFPGYIYYSTDTGNTWNQTASNGYWTFISMNSDGTNIVACQMNGKIYQSSFSNGVMISINNVTNYPGLIQNGSVDTGGFNNITVNNIIVDASTSTVGSSNGWITQSYFKKASTGSYVNNCGQTSTTSSNYVNNSIVGNTTISNLDAYYWPLTISGDAWGNQTTVTLPNSSMTVIDPSYYFIIGGNNISVDGTNQTITYSNVSNYPGLFQNGSVGVAGYNNITISNLTASQTDSTLSYNAGWITQRNFEKNVSNITLTNLTATSGNISYSYSNTISGNTTITNFNLYDWPVSVNSDSWDNRTTITLSGSALTVVDPSTTFIINDNNIVIDGSGNGVVTGAAFATNNFTKITSGLPQDSATSWTHCAVSNTGQYQTMVSTTKGIYASTSYGTFWTASTSANGPSNATSYSWTGIIMNRSGQYQIANPNSGNIMWYSTNYGMNWIASTTTALPSILTAANYGFTWYSTNLIYIGPLFSTSDNGKIQVYNNTISFNGGFTFCSMRQHLNIITTSIWGTISGVAVSSSGKNITFTANSIYTSSDYGNTFFNTYKFNYSAGYMASTPSSTISFGGSAMSANGQLQLVGTQYNLSTYGAALGLYYSTDYGFNWTQISPSLGLTGGAWRAVALSGNGSYGLIGAFLANSFYGAWSFSLPNSVVISIPSIKNYSGLIQNGTSSTNGYGNILVRNIIVDASSSTLYNSTINGWIATPYFKNGAGNAYVTNVEIAKYTVNTATASIIYGNVSITDSNKDSYLWPITISGDSWGNQTVVTFNSQINIVDASYYFIIGQGNVLIDGQSNNVTISNVTSYPGLVRNGTAFADAFSNVTVQNIVLDASSSTLMNDPSNGWLTQRYFKKNATNAYVNNCSQTTTTTKNNIVWNSITGNISLSNFDDYYWPVSVSGDSWGNKTTVTLNGPILVYDPSSYFIAVRGNVAINGTTSTIGQNPLPFSINFVNVQNYPGLIQNGTATSNGYNNVTSQSINVRAGWSTLASGTNTWITQNYFKNGNTGSYAFDSSVNNIYTNTYVYIPTYRYGSISYDGRYMVGTMQNNVVMSTNYGLSWNSTIIPNNNSYNNYYNSMSYNGQYMFVNNGAGYNEWGFVLSTDYGTTWYNVPYFVEGSSWYNSTASGTTMGSAILTRPNNYQLYTTYMSGNGQYMFVTSGPAIYMSTNYGSNWSRNVYYPATGLNGLNFAVNYTGQYQLYYVNISGVGNYYLSSNYGVSYSATNITNPTTGYTTCAISYSGQYMLLTVGTSPYLYAGGKQVFMYISNNYGTSWTPITSSNGLTNLYSTYIGYTYATMDSTGQYMAVALTNNTTFIVYVSNNYGQTWRTLQSVFGSTAPSSFTSLYTIVMSGNAQYILFPSANQSIEYILNTNLAWSMPGLASNNIITGNTTIADFDSYYWPVTISGDVWGNPITVTLQANQTIIDASYYFVVGSNNVNINGNNYTITIGNVSAYPGLVQNGTASTNGFNNLSISNINVSLSGTSALSASTTGWIGQRYIQKNAKNVNITNCTVTPTTKGNVVYNTIFGSNTLQNFDDFYWPVTLSGGTYNTPAVICLSNVLITDSQQYFIIGSPYITIDGSVNRVINSVVVGNVINYPGLIQNGNTSVNGYGNTIVRNITMNYIGNSTLDSNAGWLGQSNFANGVYSTTSIINCSGSSPLLPPLTSDTTITSETLSNYLFPLSVGEGTTLTFGSDISLSSVSQIIQIGGANVTIDGGSYNVTIGNVVNYPGLIQNGGVTKNMNINVELPLYLNSAYGNLTIKNINMKSFGNTRLAQHGGWIGQQYFGTNAENIIIQNCDNYAPIDNSFGAGIVGSYAANYGGSVTIDKCNNYGNINANYAGSIAGAYAAYYGGKVLITDCSNTGNLYYYSTGGMFSTWNNFSTNPVITGNVAVSTINQKLAIQSGTKYWNISIQNGQANVYQ